MLRRIITDRIAEFMVWLIELVAIEFYEGDRALAFKDLNDLKIWHHFVEKYEEKCSLNAEAITDEIGLMLGKKRPPFSKLMLLNDGDTEFIQKIIQEISVRYDFNYSVSLEKFYTSGVCRMLSGTNVGPSAFSFDEMLEIFDKSM